uniref:Thyroglobulin type-1 domain-containing protein n=1 Tax=Kryptolebias marmoratus TaxID=37003 RepID=A0A3Q3ANY0_KRYMA
MVVLTVGCRSIHPLGILATVSLPDRPKTQCEHHRDSVQITGTDGLSLLGAYVPQCDEHGQYQPQQCHGSTGYCWCVDSRGQEIPGTRTPPGSASKDCSTEGIASLLRVIFNKIPKFIDVNLKQFLCFLLLCLLR